MSAAKRSKGSGAGQCDWCWFGYSTDKKKKGCTCEAPCDSGLCLASMGKAKRFSNLVVQVKGKYKKIRTIKPKEEYL